MRRRGLDLGFAELMLSDNVYRARLAARLDRIHDDYSALAGKGRVHGQEIGVASHEGNFIRKVNFLQPLDGVKADAFVAKQRIANPCQ
jgi:hypothetical protein